MIPISRPRIVTDGKRGYYLFRDEERGSKVSVAITNDIHSNQWTIQDLTEFSVNAWEPTYDTELWKQKINYIFLFNVQDKVMAVEVSTCIHNLFIS